EVDWRDCRFNSDLEIVGSGHKNLVRRRKVGRRALFDVLANFFAQTKRRLRLSLLTLWNDQDGHPPRDRLAGCVSSWNRASECHRRRSFASDRLVVSRSDCTSAMTYRLWSSHAQGFDRLAVGAAFCGTRVCYGLNSGDRTENLVDRSSGYVPREPAARAMNSG